MLGEKSGVPSYAVEGLFYLLHRLWHRRSAVALPTKVVVAQAQVVAQQIDCPRQIPAMMLSRVIRANICHCRVLHA